MQRNDYERALEVLARALVFGIHPSLDGIRQLTDELGRPQDAFASIQVTGTNGKTSTARLAEAILRGHGTRTGLYTSPHLERYPERIEIGGVVVGDDDFGRAVLEALDAAEKLRPGAQGTPEGFTEFELLTAAALWLFRERGVEFAVLEVGMGGTWDSTSVVDPAVAVITGVGLDHTAVLGDTVEQIAAEKAGIIKPASAPILGPGTAGLEPIFVERAEAMNTHARAVREVREPTPLTEALTVRYEVRARPGDAAGETVVDVRGIHGHYPGLALAAPSYQAANIATAVAAAEAAFGRPLDLDSVRSALLAVRLPGRFELTHTEPIVIVDGSHNPQAATALADAVKDAFSGTGLVPDVLLGVLADKDAEGIVRALAPVVRCLHVVAPDSPRALAAPELADVVERVIGHRPTVFASVADALRALVVLSAPPLIVTGSLTTAGEARRLLRDGSVTGAG